MTNDASSGNPSSERFEIIDHTADWSIRVFGHDLEQLFVNAALGMSCLMVANLNEIPHRVERRVALIAPDAETLLVDWLSELAFLAEDEQLVFGVFKVIQISRERLTATIHGGKATELLKHIKAVTFHDLKIQETESGFETTIVFDV